MRIFIVVGTRPNFIKVTRFRKVAPAECEIKIIHTGQHYDEKMAEIFFRQFDLQPDYFLGIAPGSPNTQIADIMLKLEQLCSTIGKPDLLLVPGDVNSTLAAALFANKSDIRLGHLEAGLRSHDRTMPEEFNRIVADQLSNMHFVTEPSGMRNLELSGTDMSNVYFVGNTMIDTMVAFRDQINASDILEKLGITELPFVLMTMHRPATVDSVRGLNNISALVEELCKAYRVVFPVHPRTRKRFEETGMRMVSDPNFIMVDPLDYFAFQKLIKSCSFIITDSGGIQEESTFLQKPCITLRPNTERPVTVDTGTNTLLPFDPDAIWQTIRSIESGNYKRGGIPDLWDGHATERIYDAITGTR